MYKKLRKVSRSLRLNETLENLSLSYEFAIFPVFLIYFQAFYTFQHDR